MIAILLRKEQALNADPKAIHQVNFKGNIYQAGDTTWIFMHDFFVIDEVKKAVMDFSQGNVKKKFKRVLQIYLVIIWNESISQFKLDVIKLAA